jgi:RimJ/RimL family protein N-acetyltransferase
MSLAGIEIRRAVEDDAQGIVAIVQTVAAERVYSAITRPWTVDGERSYLASLSAREAVHVAVSDAGEIVGFQSLDLWASTLESMSHVGQIGTHLVPAWRRRGVGGALFRATAAFARRSGYRKLVIQVRAANVSGQAFYRLLGFRECGRLTRQVNIDGVEDDEILMELFL